MSVWGGYVEPPLSYMEVINDKSQNHRGQGQGNP